MAEIWNHVTWPCSKFQMMGPGIVVALQNKVLRELLLWITVLQEEAAIEESLPELCLP